MKKLNNQNFIEKAPLKIKQKYEIKLEEAKKNLRLLIEK